MIDLRSRSAILSLGLATLVIGGAIVACTGDEATPPTTSQDASTNDSDASDDTPSDDAGGGKDVGTDPGTDADTSEDAGADAAEEDPDGGGTIDLDGGDGEEEPDGGPTVDAGADAGPGPCNALKASGSVDAACTTSLTLSAGGTLVAGDYSLKSVSVRQKECTTFAPTVHGGALDLTKNKDGSFTASYVLTRAPKKGTIIRPITSRYEQTLDPKGATNGSPAALENVCPEAADGTLADTSKTDKLGTTLSFYAPYYTTTALYTWTKPLVKLP